MQLLKKNFPMLIASVMIGACLTLWLGKDLNWDLANYHYYIPYAFLNNRYAIDYWPAGISTYYNPLLDCLIFFLINHFSPILVGVLLGGLQGIILWLVYLLACFVLQNYPYSHLSAFIMTALGAYSPQFISGIGMSLGDILVGEFVLISILLIVYQLNQHKVSFYYFAGFLYGMGFGLKLIIGFYSIGFLFAIMLTGYTNLKKRIIHCLIFYLGMLFGFFVTYGYWFFFLIKQFKNPFFPFFNAFFQSEYFPFINWSDRRFLPKDFWHAIFYPFYSSFNLIRCEDVPFLDLRLLIILILLLILFFKYLYYKFINKRISISTIEQWLMIFFIASFISWEMTFSFMRYIVLLMILSPILIFVLLKNIYSTSIYRRIIFSMAAVLMIVFMSTEPAERGKWENNTYFGVEIPSTILSLDKQIVFLPTQDYLNMNESPLSLSYLIPFFPEKWRFVGIPYLNIKKKALLDKAIIRLLTENNEANFLCENTVCESFSSIFKSFGFEIKKECDEIKFAHGWHRKNNAMFCQIVKVSST